MKKNKKMSLSHGRPANTNESEVRQQTPPRVAPRLKGVVKNVGIKPQKTPKKA